MISCGENHKKKTGSRSLSTIENNDSIDFSSSISLPIDETSSREFKNVLEVVTDSSYNRWVNKEEGIASLSLYFMDSGFVSIAYSPECWLMYPYQIIEDEIIVYWNPSIDIKYEYEIVKVASEISKEYKDKPFMKLILVDGTTLKADYLMKEIISKINAIEEERILFADHFTFNNDLI